jgi:hypothetical protein
MYIKFKYENLKGRDHLEVLGIYGRIILKRVLNEQHVRVWTVFI